MRMVSEWMPVGLPPDVYLPTRSKDTVPLEDDGFVVHDMFHDVEADYAIAGMVRKIDRLPGTTAAKCWLTHAGRALEPFVKVFQRAFIQVNAMNALGPSINKHH